MSVIIFIVIIILFGLAGVFCWAASDIPKIIREVALNTRKAGSAGSSYPLVDLLSLLIKIWAVVLWLAGLFLAIASLQLGNLLTSGLTAAV